MRYLLIIMMLVAVCGCDGTYDKCTVDRPHKHIRYRTAWVDYETLCCDTYTVDDTGKLYTGYINGEEVGRIDGRLNDEDGYWFSVDIYPR